MPISVPDNPKVQTATYDNFRGVDFTNDATNVWRRRSPTGVNMLPDAAGRPFKRHGWEILISNEQICEYLEVESCSIQKCSWFELGGEDHIVIFTDCGVAFYNGEFTDKSTDYDCFSGYDRCFFFEGNGIAAFYIYGGFKVWRYESDFQLHDVTDEITVPSVIIGADASGSGTAFDGYNLLGSLAAVEYSDVTLWTSWASDGLQVYVDDSFKTGKTINAPAVYRYLWNGSAWVDELLTGVAFDPTKIKVVGEPIENDEIIIVYGYGVMLPNNVSPSQIEPSLKVQISISAQFDYVMPVVAARETLTSGKCMLWDDDTEHRANGRAWVQFYSSDVGSLVKPIIDGQDYIKVTFPSVEIVKREYANVRCTGAAALVEG